MGVGEGGEKCKKRLGMWGIWERRRGGKLILE